MSGGRARAYTPAGSVVNRQSRQEWVRECPEDGSGWRVDDKGFWWPCQQTLGPLPTREEYRAKKAQEAG
jgi:hypothetical protein